MDGRAAPLPPILGTPLSIHEFPPLQALGLVGELTVGVLGGEARAQATG